VEVVCQPKHPAYLAKISALYSHKLITQPNFAVLTACTDAADVDFN